MKLFFEKKLFGQPDERQLLLAQRRNQQPTKATRRRRRVFGIKSMRNGGGSKIVIRQKHKTRIDESAVFILVRSRASDFNNL